MVDIFETYAWEDPYYTLSLMQEIKSSKKRGLSFWLPPMVFSTFCYIQLVILEPVARLFLPQTMDPLSAQLVAELYSKYIHLAVFLLAPAFCLVYYIGIQVITPMLEKADLMTVSTARDDEERRRSYLAKYRQYAEKKSFRWQQHVFFYIVLAVEVIFAIQVFYFSTSLRDTQRLSSDVELLRSGSASVYEGRFQLTDRPASNDHSYIMLPDKRYYFFTSDMGTFRCIKSNLQFTELMQAEYRVEYLPGTYTVLSVSNADGVVLTGPDGPSAPNLPKGHWLYGDLIVKYRDEVYGYDQLTGAGRQAFDLMYGEYFSRAVSLGDKPTQTFPLPTPIPKAEFNRVLALYQTATLRFSNPAWRYDTNDEKMVAHVYAGGILYSQPEVVAQFDRAHVAAAAVVADMPPNLTDDEKYVYFASYLLEHARYQTIERPQTSFKDSDGVTLTILSSNPPAFTAYGALVEGKANDQGFAAAFASLAYEAGMDCIVVSGYAAESPHVWNMVSLHGHWYHIDLTQMNDAGVLDDRFFLVTDSEIGGTHRALAYGNCDFIPPPAADTAINN